MKFTKYHALGNDYVVIRPTDMGDGVEPRRIERICHRNYGLGSDGVLLGPFPSTVCDFKLRIFNPDGSEAEKSGNGLRIFSRFLWDEGLTGQQPFTVETLGGSVTCQVNADGRIVTVEMGTVSFDSTAIPVTGSRREVLREHIVRCKAQIHKLQPRQILAESLFVSRDCSCRDVGKAIAW